MKRRSVLILLQERGWRDGGNVRFECRYTEGQLNRLPAFAADLVQRNVDVIVTLEPSPPTLHVVHAP